MGKAYLSFLGTNDYLPCTYFFGEKEKRGIRFVQEASIDFFCMDWSSEDRLYLFTTQEAADKNWRDNGHWDKQGNRMEREGLGSRLSRLNLAAKTERVPIPEGKSEEEIWEIFQSVYERFQPDDRVIFDITHAFRSIPMLAIVILQYAKVLKKISLQGIYYGAFEVMGSLPEALKLPERQRRAPIFDLTPFDTLLDWTLAIDCFLKSGDSSAACSLAQKGIKTILRETKGQNKAAKGIRKVTDQLQSFSNSLSTCRGQRITPSVNSLKEALISCENIEYIKPLKPLLELLKSRVASFGGNLIKDGICAARWCLDHNLIQQGYTILQETLVNYFVQQAGANIKNRDHRELVSQTIYHFKKKDSPKKTNDLLAKYPEITVNYFNVLENQPDLADSYTKLTDSRNDLNHAGFRENPRPSESFGLKLTDLINEVEGKLSLSNFKTG